MASAQEELRRLMKEAKQKTSATFSHPKKSTIKPKASAAKPTSSSSNQAKSTIPAGFFDDSLADAKARNVDVQQLAEKQLESEWEAFQEFAAEVEKQSAKEEQELVEETKEREAVEQLDNMQYVDRYRVALERATNLRNGEKKTKTEKRGLDAVVEGEETNLVETAMNEYKKRKK
eukprot:jgi/Phyca11/20403/fgenesh1_pg.PHYCAscaffold_63_\